VPNRQLAAFENPNHNLVVGAPETVNPLRSSRQHAKEAVQLGVTTKAEKEQEQITKQVETEKISRLEEKVQGQPTMYVEKAPGQLTRQPEPEPEPEP